MKPIFRAWHKSAKLMGTVTNLNYRTNGLWITMDHIAFPVHEKNVILEQFTGLYDTDGRQIYAGDIVRGQASAWKGKFQYFGQVRWLEENTVIGWVVEEEDGGCWNLSQLHAGISLDNITGNVVGDIHHDPDMLNTHYA